MEKLIHCCLNNEPTPNPVVCKKTGYVFDRDTIKIFLEKNGKRCPLTSLELDYPEDFIEIQALEGPNLSVKSALSRSQIFGRIAENYNDMIKEAKTYKTTISLLKKKLISSLKTQKSALNLIVKLKKERNQVRKALAETEYELKETGVERVRETTDEEKLFDEVKKSALRLNKVRKEMAKVYNQEISGLISPVKDREWNSVEMKFPQFQNFGYKILAHPFNSDVYLVSNQENFSAIFNLEENSVKKIFDVSFGRCEHLLSSGYLTPDSEDQMGYVMSMNDGSLQAGILNSQDGSGEVLFKKNINTKFLNLVQHPVNRILAGLDEFRNFSLFDLNEQMFVLNKLIEDDLELNCLNVHPDGKLAAIGGSDNNLHFYDISSNQIVLTLESACVSIDFFLILLLGKNWRNLFL